MTERDEENEKRGHVTKQDLIIEDCQVANTDEKEDRCIDCETNRQTENYGSWKMSQIASHCQTTIGNPDCCLKMGNGKVGKKSAKDECSEVKNTSSSASHDKGLQADCNQKKCCDKGGRCKRVCMDSSGMISQIESGSGCQGCYRNCCDDKKFNDTTVDGYDDSSEVLMNNPDEQDEDFDEQDRSWKKQESHLDVETPFRTLDVDIVESNVVSNEGDETANVEESDKNQQSDHSNQDKNQENLVNEQNGVNEVLSKECVVVQTEISDDFLQLSEIPNPVVVELPMTDSLQGAPSDGDGRSIAIDKNNSNLNDRPLEFLSLSGCYQITVLGLE